MVATGSEAVTLEQLKRLKDSSSGEGGAAIQVFELTESKPSFAFEKSGIEFTRYKNDFTVVAVDSKYGVGVLGVFQHGKSNSAVTVANVTGGASVNRTCYFTNDSSGVGDINYNGKSIMISALSASIYASVSLWIDSIYYMGG